LTEFSDFGLARPIMQALANEGHAIPTPIQIASIPPLMAGRDLLGIAQTGTGKTAAFALPILHRLAAAPRPRRSGECRVLVLAPTRELAAQVLERFCAYGRGLNVRAGLVIGGASINKQKAMARSGVDIIVATPGRLVDLIDQGALSIGGVETFVLDEVDQMLDLGFIHAIRAIAAKLPAERQNVFLSATIPTAIARLAAGLLRDPARVEISAKEPLKIEQSVMLMESGAKPAALFEVVRRKEFTRGLIFTRTKRGADKVVRALNSGGAPAFAIHGNRSQGQREQALNAFRSGKARILVATDIAARGIDITGVSHVINYDLPDVPETYVHRIGRTARAGATGVAISFCSHEERGNLRSIERLTRQTIAVAGGASHDDAARETARPRKNKGDDNGERGTARIRRRRHRGSAGRGLSRAAG
jgi:ATP-dependent RNA helicase RhlE